MGNVVNAKNKVPQLRFPEFSGEWSVRKLSEFVQSKRGGASLKPHDFVENSSYQVIPKKAVVYGGRLTLDYQNPTFCTEEFFALNQTSVVDTTFLITTLRDLVPTAPTLGLVVVNPYKERLLMAQGVYGFKLSSALNGGFLCNLSNSIKYRRLMYRMCVGSTQVHIRSSEFFEFSFYSPDIEEQNRLNSFLFEVDNKISLLKQKHEKLVQYKKGIMQQLFSQQLRFKDDNGQDFPDWEKNRLDYFLERTSDAVEVDKTTKYRQIGIRSHGKGIFHKDSVSGEELGDKRVFWVHTKALVLNIVFAWEHAVAVTSDSESGMIASHRFPMYVPKNNRADLDFMGIFFLRPRGKYLLGIASPGGAGRNKTLGQSNFSELKVTLPCLDEQNKIASFVKSIDQKINLAKQKIEQTQAYKQGLLQQMFV